METMATTGTDLIRWLNAGVKKGATHMMVMCDTFSYEDYPVYVMPGEDINEKTAPYANGAEPNMQRLMGTYNVTIYKAELEKEEKRKKENRGMKQKIKLNINELNTAVREREKQMQETMPEEGTPDQEESSEDSYASAEETRKNLHSGLPRIMSSAEVIITTAQAIGLNVQESIVVFTAAILTLLKARPELAKTYDQMREILSELVNKHTIIMEDDRDSSVLEGHGKTDFPLGEIVVTKGAQIITDKDHIDKALFMHGTKRWGDASEPLLAFNNRSIEAGVGTVISKWNVDHEGTVRSLLVVTALTKEFSVTKVAEYDEEPLLRVAYESVSSGHVRPGKKEEGSAS